MPWPECTSVLSAKAPMPNAAVSSVPSVSVGPTASMMPAASCPSRKGYSSLMPPSR
ncbi:Uncharacterised protein [Mycobacterium tuberculosis]|nr:Uncharacterised protein [Mycobacterium tuberculosis]